METPRTTTFAEAPSAGKAVTPAVPVPATTGTIVTIAMTSYTMLNGNNYVVVVDCPSCDAANRIYVRINDTGGTGIYTWKDSTNSGSSWSDFTPYYVYSLIEGDIDTGIPEEEEILIDWGSATTTNRMLGSLNLGITILITFAIIGFSGYLWNKTGKRKPWQ